MATSRFNRGWAFIIFILAVIVATGGIIIWTKNDQNSTIEIDIIPEPELLGDIHIDGEVNNPGFYSLKTGDSIKDMLQIAGGTTSNADLSRLILFVPSQENGEEAQKININRAEAWLLETLPGIGEIKSKAIIEYRQQKGMFRNIIELVNVEGIGDATYEEIKHLITVSD